jgi:hypothetical protein
MLEWFNQVISSSCFSLKSLSYRVATGVPLREITNASPVSEAWRCLLEGAPLAARGELCGDW